MAATVLGGFDALFADLALTDPQKAIAEGRVRHLVSYFRDRDIACATLPFKIGSYERGTVIRWNRDIDVMVALDFPTYKDRYYGDSAAMLRWIRDRMDAEYSSTVVSRQQVAVRMFLGDGFQVDLVPAFPRTGGGYIMPTGRGGWLATNPPYHASIMTDANVDLDFKLKPLVRVMKAWNEANGHHLRSFHLEIMVWEMWHDEKALPPLPEAVSRTLDLLGAIWLKYSTWDPWGDAGAMRLDDYLSNDERGVASRLAAGDHKRAEAAIAFDRAGRVADAIEKWMDVFPGRFPA